MSMDVINEKSSKKTHDDNAKSEEPHVKELTKLLNLKDGFQSSFQKGLQKHTENSKNVDVFGLATYIANRFKISMCSMILLLYIGAYLRKRNFDGKELMLTFISDFLREREEKNHNPKIFTAQNVFGFLKYNLVLLSFAFDHITLTNNTFSFFYNFIHPMIFIQYPHSESHQNTNIFYTQLLILYRFDFYWFSKKSGIYSDILNANAMYGNTIENVIDDMFTNTNTNTNIIIISSICSDADLACTWLRVNVNDYNQFHIIIGNYLYGHFVTVSFIKDTNNPNLIYFQIYDSSGAYEANNYPLIPKAWQQAFRQVYKNDAIDVQFKYPEFYPVRQTRRACGLFSIINMCILLKRHKYTSKSLFVEKYIELVDQLYVTQENDKRDTRYLFLFYAFCIVKCSRAETTY